MNNDMLPMGKQQVVRQNCGKAALLSEWRQGIAQRDAAIAQSKKMGLSFDKEDIKSGCPCPSGTADTWVWEMVAQPVPSSTTEK
jgi:hypothetical protein